jgi:hypothetical protein
VPTTRRDREQDEQRAEQPEGLRTVVPDARAAAVLELQQGYGNAHVSRLIGAGGAAIARRKDPSVEQSVGAQPGTATFVADTSTKDKDDTLAAGEAGFTFQMLKEVPKAAGKTFAYYQDHHLKTVKPDFKFLDEKQLPWIAQKQTKAQDELDAAEGKGWTEFRTIPSVIRNKKEKRDYWQTKGQLIAADRAKEDALVQNFNASVPRANHMFGSLARLEAMEEMLGVKSPKEMSAALIKSMEEVEPMAEGLAAKSGELPLMKASEAVAGAAQRSTQAQKEMQAAWRATQEFLIMDHVAELKKKGETDEKRLAKITEIIGVARQVGGVVDLSMGVMSGGVKMIEGTATGKLTPSQLGDLAAEEDPTFKDKGAKEGAKKVGGAITKAMGIEIPTSVGGLLETGAKIWFWSELEEIRKRLATLNTQISHHESVAKDIGLKAKFDAFAATVTNFQLANEELQKHMFDRQRAYLQLGQKLDEAAAKAPGAKAAGRGKGKERFATVMTLVSAVREVLAVGTAAQGSLKPAAQLREELSAIAEHRDYPLKGLPRGEFEPLKQMLDQTESFDTIIENLTADLGPIDAKAGQLMATITGGEEGAAY